MSEKEGKSLQRLGQIFATLSGGFFVAFGVMISLWGNLVSTTYRIVDIKHKIAGSNYINQTTRNQFMNQSANISTKITEASIELIDFGYLFLCFGSVSATLALFCWWRGHKKIKKNDSIYPL